LIQTSVDYLNSPGAIQSIEANPYWPKWNSPWWHMSVLFEMGLADRIPKASAQKMLEVLRDTPLDYFFESEAPASRTEKHEAPCPCMLGNMYQILAATGLEVDIAFPWMRAWFLRYQMKDGGLSCDEHAYRADANASSMVGTIACLEAILSAKNLTPEEEQFLDRGAKCLLDRELRFGSSSEHNADERNDEADWLRPCFPRFYFYDVLRGLSFVLKWAELRNQPLSFSLVKSVVDHLESRFPDGQIRIERQSYDGVTSRSAQGRIPASHFPLMDEVSRIGEVSPFLTQAWTEARRQMNVLKSRGLLR
jgi:hypothetical protein